MFTRGSLQCSRMDAVLQFENLSKEYRDFWRRKSFRALDGFSLEVDRGEIFGFLGPNGAGKTTALHITMGLTFASSGGGKMLGKPFGDARTRRRIGFLAENVSFYRRKAADLIRFYGELNGVRDQELRSNIKDLLEALDLKEVGRRPVTKFSRGMLQKVGIAQALVNDPELLILDEPTSALDPSARVTVREILLKAKAQGKTVFLSSHLLSEIELICDRVGIIHRGKLVRLGTVSELLESKEEFEILARGVLDSLQGEPLQDGVVRFVVSAAEQKPSIEAIWSSGGEVLSVTPKKRSLEQLFLSLTSADSETDGAGEIRR
ncbi:MAG: ABC-type transport system, ATPase component [Acidobacteriales bacterium]|nr:ABC-type transport system, ATPase component [Terriglobales bacterium]